MPHHTLLNMAPMYSNTMLRSKHHRPSSPDLPRSPKTYGADILFAPADERGNLKQSNRLRSNPSPQAGQNAKIFPPELRINPQTLITVDGNLLPAPVPKEYEPVLEYQDYPSGQVLIDGKGQIIEIEESTQNPSDTRQIMRNSASRAGTSSTVWRKVTSLRVQVQKKPPNKADYFNGEVLNSFGAIKKQNAFGMPPRSAGIVVKQNYLSKSCSVPSLTLGRLSSAVSGGSRRVPPMTRPLTGITKNLSSSIDWKEGLFQLGGGPAQLGYEQARSSSPSRGDSRTASEPSHLLHNNDNIQVFAGIPVHTKKYN